MPLLPASTDYTDRDFDSLRERLVTLARSAFPEWTDFQVASFGTVLLECFAFVGDVLGFYIDAQGREARLSTATQRANVVALARMLGYVPRTSRAAVAELEIALDEAPRADVPVRAGTVVRTDVGPDAIAFQTLDAVVLRTGVRPPLVRVQAEHSTSQRQLVDALEPRRWREIRLDRAPYLDGSAVVSSPGGEYVEVASLLDSGPADRHFTVVVDTRDRATIRFGDGRTGAVVTGPLAIAYKTGGGSRGNVAPGSLVALETPLVDVRGGIVQARVTNPRPAEGGADRESLVEIRERAPLSLRAPTRTVSREDFEIRAREVPGVARALMLTSNEDPAIEENTGVLYVVPDGGGVPSPALKNAVRRQITEVYPSTLTFETSVQDPVYRVINVVARVVLRTDAIPADTREAIRARLTAAFALGRSTAPSPSVDFGYYARRSVRTPIGAEGSSSFDGMVAWSDVFDIVRDTPAVRKIASWDLLLNGLAEDVRLRPEELPALGSVTVMDASSGAIL